MSAAHLLTSRIASPARAGGRDEALYLFALATLGALLSMLATGTAYFVDNNVFHLPILGRLYDLPQYADEPFVQSLRHFASGFWQALAGADRLIDPTTLLLAISFAYRALMALGFLSCAAALGVTERRQQLVFVVLVVTCDALQGLSFAGGGTLFASQAAHSEIANGLLLLSWGAAARGRFAAALAWTGAAFFMNAFMGVWNLLPLGMMAAVGLACGEIGWRDCARSFMAGGLVFALFAAPVAANVLANPDFGAPLDFDYRAFLAEYWPKHFLFEAVPDEERIGLGVVAALAVLSFLAIGRRAGPFGAAFAGFALVYAIGVAAPALTGSPMVHNLHLLRSGVAMQMLAGLAALSVATLWLTDRGSWRPRCFGAALVVTLCVMPRSALLAVIVLAVERATRGAGRPASGTAEARAPALAAFATLLAVPLAISVVSGALTQEERNRKLRTFVAEWRSVGEWSRANTPRDAVFLTPTIELGKPVDEDGKSRATAIVTAAGFEYFSQRRVYVDVKRGAAAMWSPSYHALWRSRTTDVLNLGSTEERLRYAADHGVGYVVDLCADGGPEPLFRTKRLCVFSSAQRAVLKGSL